MNPSDILLLGMKRRVAAFERASGRLVWETKLKEGQGDFVTLLCDGRRIFAVAGGHLHCLDFATGEILWSNGLTGYGYGLGTLCLPDLGLTAPNSAALEKFLRDQQAASQSASVSVATTTH
jgi:outer membrane protein assembly factor BamB